MILDNKKIEERVKLLIISVDMLIIGGKDVMADEAMHNLTTTFDALMIHPSRASKIIDDVRTEMQKEIDLIGFNSYCEKIIPLADAMLNEKIEHKSFCDYHNNKNK